MIRIKREPTVKDKIEKIDENLLAGKISRIYVSHLSKSEKDELKNNVTMALTLEIQAQELRIKQLYDSMIHYQTENEVLKMKLKRKAPNK